MTNAEKFKEVFGAEPDKDNCPFNYCRHEKCPGEDELSCSYMFWDAEYKELENE